MLNVFALIFILAGWLTGGYRQPDRRLGRYGNDNDKSSDDDNDGHVGREQKGKHAEKRKQRRKRKKTRVLTGAMTKKTTKRLNRKIKTVMLLSEG